MGLRSIHEARHGASRMGRRPGNMASLFGHVRIDICVHCGDSRSVFVVLRGLSRNHSTTNGCEYIMTFINNYYYIYYCIYFG